MADTIRSNLTLALAVIFVGGGCVGWVGTRTLEYAFEDVREHGKAIVELQSDAEHNTREIAEIKQAMSDFAIVKEMVVRIDERTALWEPDQQ